MKSDHCKFLISISLIILISWTLSCSGKAGKTEDKPSEPASISEKEAPEQLIKLLSPEENAGTKLNQPEK